MLMFWLLAGVLYLLEINKFLIVPSFIYYILILFPIVFFVVGVVLAGLFAWQTGRKVNLRIKL